GIVRWLTPRATARADVDHDSPSVSRAQEHPRPLKFAELPHCRAAQRECGRIIMQGDPIQCTERITRGQRTCSSGNQRFTGARSIVITPHLLLTSSAIRHIGYRIPTPTAGAEPRLSTTLEHAKNGGPHIS